jgi:hypothetical protein
MGVEKNNFNITRVGISLANFHCSFAAMVLGAQFLVPLVFCSSVAHSRSKSGGSNLEAEPKFTLMDAR